MRGFQDDVMRCAHQAQLESKVARTAIKAKVATYRMTRCDATGHCSVTNLARQVAPDVYIEHGLCDDAHCPLNGGITNGTNGSNTGRWPWANAHKQASTLNCTDLFRTYDMVKALSIPEVIDR